MDHDPFYSYAQRRLAMSSRIRYGKRVGTEPETFGGVPPGCWFCLFLTVPFGGFFLTSGLWVVGIILLVPLMCICGALLFATGRILANPTRRPDPRAVTPFALDRENLRTLRRSRLRALFPRVTDEESDAVWLLLAERRTIPDDDDLKSGLLSVRRRARSESQTRRPAPSNVTDIAADRENRRKVCLERLRALYPRVTAAEFNEVWSPLEEQSAIPDDDDLKNGLVAVRRRARAEQTALAKSDSTLLPLPDNWNSSEHYHVRVLLSAAEPSMTRREFDDLCAQMRHHHPRCTDAGVWLEQLRKGPRWRSVP